MELTFDVNNQIITRTDKNRVVSNSVDYLSVAVTFTADWNGMDKQFCFKNGKTEIYIMLNDEDKITQENHLNLGVGTWKVFCIGTSQTQRILTNSVNLTVVASGYMGTDGPESRTYDELLTIIQSLHTEAASTAVIRSAVEDYVSDNIEQIINDYLGSEDGLKNMVAEIVQEYLSDDIDAATVNGHSVDKDVPANAVFTDTVYNDSDARVGYDGTTYDTLGESIRGQIQQVINMIGGGGGYVDNFTLDSGAVKGNQNNTLTELRRITFDCTGKNSFSFDWSNNGSKKQANGYLKATYLSEGTYTDLFVLNTATTVNGHVTINIASLTGTHYVEFYSTAQSLGTGSASQENQCLLNISNVQLQ